MKSLLKLSLIYTHDKLDSIQFFYAICGRWFFSAYSVSSTNKTVYHDIAIAYNIVESGIMFKG
jgi:hypothetical protein